MAIRMRPLRLRFGLATFFLAITAIAIWMSFLAGSARTQKAVVELVHQRQGQLVFQHQHDSEIVVPAGTPFTIETLPGGGQRVKMGRNGSPIVTLGDELRQPNLAAPVPGPSWLRSLLGDEFFQTVFSINVRSCNDEDLAAIARLPDVKQMSLGGVEITNHGVAHLRNMPSLESLTLTAILVNDEGVKHLHSLTGLKELTLKTNASPEAIAALKAALPQCRISSTERRSFSPQKP